MSYLLSSERYNKIQLHSERVLREYSSLQFPIDLYEIISGISDVRIELYSFQSLFDMSHSFMSNRFQCSEISKDGFTVYCNGLYTIIINDDIQEERFRFTIAHELGHITLGHFLKPDVSDEIKEAEADFFAHRLMVPMWAVDKLSCSIDTASIACHFGVSIECASHRINNYNQWLACGSPITELEEKLSKQVTFKYIQLPEEWMYPDTYSF